MSIEITDSLKAQIILTAVNTAGEGANDGKVASQVTRILNYMTDGSTVLGEFDRAAARADQVVKTKAFTGEVLFVDTETTSTRPVVFLRTQPSKHHADGIEFARLDRLDGPDVEQVKSLANTLIQLVGHKVLISVAVESTGESNVRVARGVQDRGAGSPDLAGVTNQTGWQFIDWQSDADRAKIAPKLQRLPIYQQKVQPVAG